MKKRLLIVGHGRMGRLVETLAADEGFEVAGTVSSRNASGDWPAADVAIDFSVADAVPATIAQAARRRMPIAIGTTGWQAAEAAVRSTAAAAGIGVVAAPNFAIGVNVFLAMTERLGTLMAAQPGVRRVDPRVASRRETRRAVGHGAGDGAAAARRRVYRGRADRLDPRRAPFLEPTCSVSTRRRKRLRLRTRRGTARRSRVGHCSPRAG